MEKLCYSVPEAARLMGISDPTMRKLAKQDSFPKVRVGKRILIPVKGLEEWLNSKKENDNE